MSVDADDPSHDDGKPKRSKGTGSDRRKLGKQRDGNYKVGYGKPPLHTRFKKGHSGNPRGRPRKLTPKPLELRDAPSEKFWEKEAYRKVTVRENGEPQELNALQAAIRAAMLRAMKGDRLALKDVNRIVARLEAEHRQQRIDAYIFLKEYKREGERILADCKRRGVEPPELLPHPDDIVLNPATGDAWITGPETPEDVTFYEHSVQLRDHCVLVASTFWDKPTSKGGQQDEPEGDCTLALALFFDRLLPRRYRWTEDALLSLMMDCSSLTKRERERRLANERAHLEATKPPNRYLTPELEEQVRQLTDRILRRKKAA